MKTNATAGKATVYESESGVLVFAVECFYGDGQKLVSYNCLTRKDGSLNEKCIANLREVFGWDGNDIFWLNTENISGIDFEAVIEDEEYQGKMYPKVKYLNRLGGNPCPIVDKATLTAKYAAKFKALAATLPAPSPPVRHTEQLTIEKVYAQFKGDNKAWFAILDKTGCPEKGANQEQLAKLLQAVKSEVPF